MPVGLAIALAAAGCKKEDAHAGQKSGPPAVPVEVAPAVQRAAPVDLKTFGTVEPVSTAAVKSQITGILQTVHFRKGQDVKQRDVLFTIDPRPYEAALKQAEANRLRDTAQYQHLEKEAERLAELLKKGFIAQDAYDQAKAAAEALAAAIKADSAAVETARLNLEYCTIRSPIDGRAGDLLVDQGNLVKAGDVTLVVINQVRPIEVGFSRPQKYLPAVMENMAKGPLKVLAIIPSQPDRPEEGVLTFLDNTVDRVTGSFKMIGTFANADGRLWPGQYVDVVLTVATEPDAIIIPSRALQNGQKGDYVFVVKPDMTVEDRVVTVHRALDGDSVISKGLKAGEQVVVDGQLLLVPGAKVQIKGAAGSTAPAAGPAAAPATPATGPAAPAPAPAAPATGPAAPAEKKS